MIYFAQHAEGGPVKIGCSANVPARIKQLEAHYRKPLAVLATMDGGVDKEREVHARFAHLRFGRTEQFRPGSDLMAFISRPLFVNQGDVELMPPTRTVVLSLLCMPEWKAWIEEAARHCRLSVPQLIDIALARTAREEGFDVPPPPRLSKSSK